MEQVLGTCLDRGIKVVSNAGGLNPSGLAEALVALGERLGLHPAVAYVDGDDLTGRVGALLDAGHPMAHLDTGQPLADAGVTPVTANAYLGGWGIARRAGGRRRRGGVPAGHRRVARRRPGRMVARLAARRPGRARRSRRRRSRHRVRTAGDGRQLRVPGRGDRPALPGVPGRGGRRRRVEHDHQAPRHRRPGLGRHRDRAAALRDRRAGVRRTRTSSRTSTPSPSPRTGPTGCGSPARAARHRRPRPRWR